MWLKFHPESAIPTVLPVETEPPFLTQLLFGTESLLNLPEDTMVLLRMKFPSKTQLLSELIPDADLLRQADLISKVYPSSAAYLASEFVPSPEADIPSKAYSYSETDLPSEVDPYSEADLSSENYPFFETHLPSEVDPTSEVDLISEVGSFLQSWSPLRS